MEENKDIDISKVDIKRINGLENTLSELETSIKNSFQVVDTLPENPDPNVFYFIPE